MRFLLDQNQSPIVVELLIAVGHEAVHVRDLGLSEASDAEILAVAREREAIVVTGDTDFGDLMAAENAVSPSIVLLRRQQGRRGREVGELLLSNLPGVETDRWPGLSSWSTTIACASDRYRSARAEGLPPGRDWACAKRIRAGDRRRHASSAVHRIGADVRVLLPEPPGLRGAVISAGGKSYFSLVEA